MRKGQSERNTKETKIWVSMNLDGTGMCKIDTGIGFFDHMLELFACHSRFDLDVKCEGDVKVDGHHSVEDIGITMGKLFNSLLGDKKGIERYATFYAPMDEALTRTVVDISGRPHLSFRCPLSGKVGEFDAELAEEFFRAFASYGMLTVHIDSIAGGNTHHVIESVFKSFAHALAVATRVTGDAVPSSKGVLE